MNEIVIIPNKCDNCGECVKACISTGLKSRVGRKRRVSLNKSRILIRKIGNVFYPFFCHQCIEAPCVDACISGAMWQNSSGIVSVNTERCVACWSCVMACPFGVVRPQEESKFALKCELCEGLFPPCVKVCKQGALIIGEEDGKRKLALRVEALIRGLRLARSDNRK